MEYGNHGVNGGTVKMEKPMDQPKKKYTVNETVPKSSSAMPISESQENSGDLSTRFTG